MPSLSITKQQEVVLFSSTAIALYGYDQGMMSLINTNKDYLHVMGIGEEDPLVGILVAVYYLGCSVGAVLFSRLSDVYGRKISIFACLATASLGNLVMFLTGLGGWTSGAIHMFWIGRVVMGLGVGGIDAVIPVYSSELSSDHARGKALAQEFQMNIFGLNMAFGINLWVTDALGKSNQWAWRIPIVVMQAYPVLLLLVIGRLPESPRWFVFQNRKDEAKEAIIDIHGEEDGEAKAEELFETHDKEKDEDQVSYMNMLTPSHPTFHPTVITVMGQINQALTGYGAVSVYGPQIFEVSAYFAGGFIISSTLMGVGHKLEHSLIPSRSRYVAYHPVPPSPSQSASPPANLYSLTFPSSSVSASNKQSISPRPTTSPTSSS